MPSRPLRDRRAAVAAVAVAALTLADSATAQAAMPGHTGSTGITVHYAIARPLCATKIQLNHVNCFAERRVEVKKGTPGAVAFTTPGGGVGAGPAGGLTPADLAAAYDFNAATPRSGQKVGIIDWFDDPHALSDLDTFDAEYGYPAETSSSFKKVNEFGKTSPLPSSSKGVNSAGEIALDIESVRAVCNTCKILLVEANTSDDKDIAAAVDKAVAMGATEVSNSYGSPEEKSQSGSFVDAYNHPGVVITASTGDDGWFDWDYFNNPSAPDESDSVAEFPSTDPAVVSVGGTTLDLNSNGSIADQSVWNNDGPDDSLGVDNGSAQGAGGGGCSKVYAAPAWQASFPGYTAAGCGGKRLAADISADADPNTGLDIYDTWGSGDHGWVTIGGTSLASPVIAAMFALAGGAQGAAYPARSLYENASLNPADVYDVTTGGNGFCGGDTTANCLTAVQEGTRDTADTNPNALGGGLLDCSFPRNKSNPTTAPALSTECNATTGYDGPSGLGSPYTTRLLASTSPVVTLKGPKTAKVHKSVTFSATALERLTGQKISKVSFYWGDGRTTSGSASQLKRSHAYKAAGTYGVTLLVTDSAGQASVASARIVISKKG